MTVLLVEHDMDFVMGLVDRLVNAQFRAETGAGACPRLCRRTRPCVKPIWEHEDERRTAGSC